MMKKPLIVFALLALLFSQETSFSTPSTQSCPASSPSATSYDVDAQNFFNVVTGLSGQEKTAVNVLVKYLKSFGLWAKLDVVYPFVGGTATSCSYNLKDTTTFRITWGNSGSWVFNSLGITGNGSSTYGDTGYIPSSSGINASLGNMSMYGYMHTSPGDNQTLWGATSMVSGADRFALSYCHPANNGQCSFSANAGLYGTPFLYTGGNYKGPTLLGRYDNTHEYLFNQFHSPDSDGGNFGSYPTTSCDGRICLLALYYSPANGGPWYWSSATMSGFCIGASMHTKADWDSLNWAWDSFANLTGRYAR